MSSVFLVAMNENATQDGMMDSMKVGGDACPAPFSSHLVVRLHHLTRVPVAEIQRLSFFLIGSVLLCGLCGRS
jgi:hypothetical protein